MVHVLTFCFPFLPYPQLQITSVQQLSFIFLNFREEKADVITSTIENVDAAPETSTPQPRMIPCIKVTNGARFWKFRILFKLARIFRGRYIVKTFSGGSNQNGVPVVKIPANNRVSILDSCINSRSSTIYRIHHTLKVRSIMKRKVLVTFTRGPIYFI